MVEIQKKQVGITLYFNNFILFSVQFLSVLNTGNFKYCKENHLNSQLKAINSFGCCKKSNYYYSLFNIFMLVFINIKIIIKLMAKRKSFIFLAIICLIAITMAAPLLDPATIPQFTQTISGNLDNILSPTASKYVGGKLTQEDYTIYMSKQDIQILPPPFGPTTMYVYGGQVGQSVTYSYPGPAIVAKSKVPINAKYVNLIDGPHILPVDYSNHFPTSDAFVNQVPVIPHLHGGITDGGSDGYPLAYWTKSGARGPRFATMDSTLPNNTALFRYTNEQLSSLNWYHDHAVGITRLNAYAGLAGLYEITQVNSTQQFNLKNTFGTLQRKYFAISDKSFQTDGQLYYPTQAFNPDFQTWIPQFFGNTIVVNGKVWPKMNLSNKRYRFVFLNACGSRFINIYFQDALANRLPFDLIRADADYYRNPVTVNAYLMQPAARVELIIDLTNQNGDIIMKNDAAGPYPFGNPVIPSLDGNIMKIVVTPAQTNSLTQSLASLNQKLLNYRVTLATSVYSSLHQSLGVYYTSSYSNPVPTINIKPGVFPAYGQGQKVFYTLLETNSNNQVAGSWIDAVPFHISDHDCTGRTFSLNQVYDWYFINLTPDAHPMHIHIINFQKVAQYPLDVVGYTNAYFALNGQPSPSGYTSIPQTLDPTPYMNVAGAIPVQPHEQVFRDVLTVLPGYVTVIRAKFAHNDNSRPYQAQLSGDNFVFHCHILQHEDNDMMSRMCII